MNPEYHAHHVEEEANPNSQAQSERDSDRRPGGEREPKLSDELTPAEQGEKEKAAEKRQGSATHDF